MIDDEYYTNPPRRVREDGSVENVISRERTSLVLSPAQLAEYSRVDPSLPAMILQAEMATSTQTYRHAMYGMTCGLLVQCLFVGGFIYLTTIHEPIQARWLLGGEAFAIVGTFIKARLGSK